MTHLAPLRAGGAGPRPPLALDADLRRRVRRPRLRGGRGGLRALRRPRRPGLRAHRRLARPARAAARAAHRARSSASCPSPPTAARPSSCSRSRSRAGRSCSASCSASSRRWPRRRRSASAPRGRSSTRSPGSEGLGGFLLLVAASLVTTAVFLGIAALLSAGAVGRKRTRALALALVVWFVAVVLFDLAALGLASRPALGHRLARPDRLGDREPDRRRPDGDAPRHRGHGRLRRRLARALPLHAGRLGRGPRARRCRSSSGSSSRRRSRCAACGGRMSRPRRGAAPPDGEGRGGLAVLARRPRRFPLLGLVLADEPAPFCCRGPLLLHGRGDRTTGRAGPACAGAAAAASPTRS